MRRWLKGLLLGLLTGLLGAALDLSPLGTALEQRVGLDWLFGIRGEADAPGDVVVVGINAQTSEQLGLPASPQEWPRTIHAQLIDKLVGMNAAVIVFDIYFGQPKTPEHDTQLIDAVQESARVVLVEKLTGKRQPITDQQGMHRGSVWVEELLPPLPALAGAARGLAPFPLPKVDAAVYEFWTFKSSVGDAPTMPAVALQLQVLAAYPKWQQLVTELGLADTAAPAEDRAGLSTADRLQETMVMLRLAYQSDPAIRARVADFIAREESSADAAHTQGMLRALDALYAGEPHRYLNFYGTPGTITTIPYQSIIKGDDPNLAKGALDLTGKTVFVGFSDLYDPGQPDRFYTVYTNSDGVDLSGVEIAATAYANLRTDKALRTLDWVETSSILLLLGLSLGMTIFLLPSAAGVPLALAIAALYATAAQWLFNNSQLWLPLANPLLVQSPLAIFVGLLGNYLWERRRGERISRALNYYLPENIARELAESRLDPSAANRVVHGTCLATDMAGFSTLAEQLPPGELAAVLNDYFEMLAAPLRRHDVDVTEFRADAIMCAWTAAEPNRTTRAKAVLAALEAVDAIAQFKERHKLPSANLRIGLECGTFYVGHAGGGGHFVFSIVGDCANTASRIEGLNKHLGTQLLATESVVDGLDDLLVRSLGRFQFVGKTEALPIVELVAARGAATAQQIALCKRFSAAMNEFREARWAEAFEAFSAILDEHPYDGPSRFFRSRCERYRGGDEAPDDPGVIRMDAK